MDYRLGDKFYYMVGNKLRYAIVVAKINKDLIGRPSICYTIHKYSDKKNIPVKVSNNTVTIDEFDMMIDKYYIKWEPSLFLRDDTIE